MPELSTVALAGTLARREPWIAKSALGPVFCSPPVPWFLVLVITPIWNMIIFVGLAVNIKTFFFSREHHITIPAAMGNFLATDNPPWYLLMAESVLYSISPAIFYYSFRWPLLGGLVTGSVAGA
jgi:ABC-type glycerol-3-phosphate transport system permease component